MSMAEKNWEPIPLDPEIPVKNAESLKPATVKKAAILGSIVALGASAVANAASDRAISVENLGGSPAVRPESNTLSIFEIPQRTVIWEPVYGQGVQDLFQKAQGPDSEWIRPRVVSARSSIEKTFSRFQVAEISYSNDSQQIILATQYPNVETLAIGDVSGPKQELVAVDSLGNEIPFDTDLSVLVNALERFRDYQKIEILISTEIAQSDNGSSDSTSLEDMTDTSSRLPNNTPSESGTEGTRISTLKIPELPQSYEIVPKQSETQDVSFGRKRGAESYLVRVTDKDGNVWYFLANYFRNEVVEKSI
jgi:hypothetical protein